jgi:hypothetical protein
LFKDVVSNNKERKDLKETEPGIRHY